MFSRVDKLLTELPEPRNQDPNAAAALQELLGGKYGEMSTLNNYLFQSVSFRSKAKLRPFYDLVASITAEEIGHVELVATAVNMLNNGPDKDEAGGADVSGAPFEAMKDIRLAGDFMSRGGAVAPFDANGAPWNGTFVTTTGNLIQDLVFNFHLECGARIHKLRVYETLSDPTGREVCGYLLVRGSVHAHAYALALKKLTGVNVEKLLPTPNINLDKIPESKKYLDAGKHLLLYTGQHDDSFKSMAGIWGGGEMALPGDPPGELQVVEGMPEGGRVPNLEGQPSSFSPDYEPQEWFDIASKLYKASR